MLCNADFRMHLITVHSDGGGLGLSAFPSRQLGTACATIFAPTWDPRPIPAGGSAPAVVLLPNPDAPPAVRPPGVTPTSAASTAATVTSDPDVLPSGSLILVVDSALIDTDADADAERELSC
jgi:hypothetical protein